MAYSNEKELRTLSKEELEKVCVNLGMDAAEVSSMLSQFGSTDAFLDYIFSKTTGKDAGGTHTVNCFTWKSFFK